MQVEETNKVDTIAGLCSGRREVIEFSGSQMPAQPATICYNIWVKGYIGTRQTAGR